MGRLLLSLSLLVSLLCFGTDSRAALVTWTVQGTLLASSIADPGNSLGLVAGEPYLYSITFDSSTPGQPNGGSYVFPDSVLAVSFTSGTFQVSLAPGELSGMGATANNFGAGGPVLLDLLDTSYPVMLALPIAPPTYAGTQIRLTYGNPFSGTGFLIYAGQSQMSYSVPEPGLALLACWIGLAFAVKRRP